MSVCVGDSSHLTPFGTDKYYFYFVFELANCGSPKAEGCNNCFSLTRHTFLFFLFLFSFFFILSINETLAQSIFLGLIARLSSNHIWVFFRHVGNFHYFNPAVTFGIPESFSLPFLMPPWGSEAQTSEGPLGIFTSVGIEDEGHCVLDIQQQVLRLRKSLLGFDRWADAVLNSSFPGSLETLRKRS